MKVEELQRQIEERIQVALQPLIPSGLHPHVQILQPAASTSIQAGDSIVIVFDAENEPELRYPTKSLQLRDFKPITIRGEPLSATVIRDRR